MKPLILTTAIVLSLTACTPTLVEKLPYYKLSVIQGVPFDAQAVLGVQTGMTRQQVAMELGTPLLRPALRNDHWDYVYEVVKGNKIKEQRNLTVFFDANGTVARVEGDALDYAREQLPNYTAPRRVVSPTMQTSEQSLQSVHTP